MIWGSTPCFNFFRQATLRLCLLSGQAGAMNCRVDDWRWAGASRLILVQDWPAAVCQQLMAVALSRAYVHYSIIREAKTSLTISV
jgi:hypothetical protein